MENQTPDPMKSLIKDLLEERYEGVTFSDEIVETIETKVAPIIRKQTEESVLEFVSDFFSAKKPTRKPRKVAKKAAPPAETSPTPEEASTADINNPKTEDKAVEASLESATSEEKVSFIKKTEPSTAQEETAPTPPSF